MDNTNNLDAKSWAKKEIALAIASEKEAAKGTDEWEYGVKCYESAMKAYNVLLSDKHSGTTIHIIKGILNRLIDGKCLTPIEDKPDSWIDVTWEKDKTKVKHYQSKRMSSFFKDVAEDGTVTYSDIERVQCINIEDTTFPFHNGFATMLVDKIFPITTPYLPSSKPFRLFIEEFLTDPKNGDYDTRAFLYLLVPDGRYIELNKYFKADSVGQLVPIEKAEYEERKARRIRNNPKKQNQ